MKVKNKLSAFTAYASKTLTNVHQEEKRRKQEKKSDGNHGHKDDGVNGEAKEETNMAIYSPRNDRNKELNGRTKKDGITKMSGSEKKRRRKERKKLKKLNVEQIRANVANRNETGKQVEALKTLQNIHKLNELQRQKVIGGGEKKEAKDDRFSANLLPFLYDSRVQASKCFDWLIRPHRADEFFKNNWEQKPLVIKRKKPDYYSGIFSTTEFDKILRENHIEFNKNLDITSYTDDERKTFNPDGRAYAPVVWDFFQNGCSIRFLNPQTYSRSVWKLNSILQEHFGSFVGANVYLTPAGSQGFAPHYDDIEAFILQLEGKKRWKVYKPLDNYNTLPRYSSKNFKRSDLTSDPIITVDLEPGDMLYFPRGFIHEAETVEDIHSLHITLSTFQKNTFGDLMEKMLSRTLQIAMEEDIEFRESLPRDYQSFMGIANEDMQNEQRDGFFSKIIKLMNKLVNYAPIDSSCDQMAKNFIHDSLPPVLYPSEKASSIHGGGEKWVNGQVENAIELEPDTLIKLIRHSSVRLVMEDDTVRLYHNLENSREYHEKDMQYIDIGAALAPAIEFLLHTYPKHVSIEELPLSNLDDKMEIANLLFDKGLVTIIEADSVSSSSSDN